MASGEKGEPLFLHTLTAFWLDFEGLGPPGGLKKQEKTASKKSQFFRCEKKATQTVFCDFGLLFGVILGSPLEHFRVSFWTLFGEGLRDRFGTLFGSILEVFWTTFGSMFGIILEVFFMENVVLPAWELNFQNILCFPRFLFC